MDEVSQIEIEPAPFKTSDGYPLVARLIRRADAARLLAFFESLSSETRRRRFHAGVDHLSAEVKAETARRYASVDNRSVAGAVIAVDAGPQQSDNAPEEEIVGVARLGRRATDSDLRQADAAIVVRDDFQGRGVAAELLPRLVALARYMQFDQLVAEIEADNLPAIRLFRTLQLPMEARTSRAETILTIFLR